MAAAPAPASSSSGATDQSRTIQNASSTAHHTSQVTVR